MTTITIDQRVAALPAHIQTSFRAYLEYLEFKAALPSYRSDKEALREGLGPRLRAVREALQQSEEAAAEIAGVALSTYQRYEKGNIGRWSTAKFTNYADRLNLSIDWLLEGDGSMFRGDRRPDIEPSAEPVPEPKPAPRRCAAHAPASVVRPAASNVIDWKAARARKGGAK
jgi:transcriptional regulator with XRE-family HTH domain